MQHFNRRIGFEAVMISGEVSSFQCIGEPDAGIITMTEMVANAHNVASVVDIPVIADADTGFGNAINVVRTTTRFIQAGIAAFQVEDQVLSNLGRSEIEATMDLDKRWAIPLRRYFLSWDTRASGKWRRNTCPLKI